VGTGEEAIARARNELPNLVILDLMLPDVDGLSVCRSLKSDADTAAIPIIMLTAKGEEVDIVTGLELGAEDYVVKPFSPRVLLARIRAALRHEEQVTESADRVLKLDTLVLDAGCREVRLDGELVKLTFTEFELLHHMLKHPGWVFSRAQLIDAVRGNGYAVTERSVDVQVVGLRKKLDEFGDRLETVRGVGYRLRR
jgi:two-component system phosphate regulon response regulator PhoB